MADRGRSLDAVRREFADLTGLYENAALIASAGQDIKSHEKGRARLRQLLAAMDRIRGRLAHLERCLR